MRVLIVGWDAADWKIIDPLLARGEMPHLASVIASGMRGNIATIYPALSPMLWTSIATGKRPTKHGIHGFTEPTPDGLHVRPVSNLGRKTKAIWNILNQNGKRSIVVGWWPSHPAEPIRGAMVSNHFAPQISHDPGAPLPPGTVWPESLADSLSDLRVHGIEVTGEILRMFASDYDQVDQEQDKSVHDLAALIAESMSVHGAATELLEHEPWDFAAVYYVGIDHFSHRFMRYHAGARRGRGLNSPEIFQDVVRNAYRFHDVMLGRLLELAGPDCAVMVVSDHGFHSDRLLPDYVPAEAAGPAVEHRHFGMVCLRAPGVPAGEVIYGATVLDVAPTLLHLFGLPPGRDMDGKVLIGAFPGQPLLKPIPSWDEAPGDDGRHSGDLQYDGVAAAESMRQLVALGYVAPPSENAARYVEECVIENRYNLARAWIDAQRPDEAATILRELIAGDPESGRFHPHLFECLLKLDNEEEAANLLDRFDAACAAMAPRAISDLQRRREERPDEQLSIRPEGPDARERHERRRLAEKADGYSEQRQLMRCSLALAVARRTGEMEPVREALSVLADQPRRGAGRSIFLADGFARAGMEDRALDIIRQARLEDPERWEVISLEARIHHGAGRHNEAANCAIESLALVYFQPSLHFLLGQSLIHLGEEERAVIELGVALAQTPGMIAAEEELARIQRRRGEIGQAGLHMARAEMLRRRASVKPKDARSAQPASNGAKPVVYERLAPPPEDRAGVITVVTGLPRSGTSMMMQMLNAAGIAPYTDGLRVADEDNPRGYFEHEQATRLRQDRSWIPQARGRVVKIVAQLLPYLPSGEQYRVVFLRRAMEEILASQQTMLARLGRTGAALSRAELTQAYSRDLVCVQDWLAEQSAIPVLAVEYDDAIRSPARVAQRLADFLGAPFDQLAASATVVAGLRRATSVRG